MKHMTASQKNSKIEWAIAKMAELANDGDVAGIEKIAQWAEDYARGSNDRKDRLEAARKEAIAKAQPEAA